MSEFPIHREAGVPRGRGGRHVAVARTPMRAAPPRVPLPVELAAFASMIDPALLEAAARRAAMLGVGGDEVLRCHGIVPPDLIADAVAERLGLAVDPLDDAAAPNHLETACAGVLARTAPNGETLVTVAPRGDGVRRLAELLARDPQLARRLRVAAPERLARHVRKVCAAELARQAVHGLHARRPDLSAVGYGRDQLRWFTLLFCTALVAAGALTPERLFVAIEYFLALSFIAWMSLRLFACCVPERAEPARGVPERHLPIYTLIVPLYREAALVPRLVAALRNLDYPREKLDILLVLEEDDAETRVAAAKFASAAPFEIVIAPRADPRTKPKALAAALPFARGSFVAVYDAEDEPEPDQLRKAVAAFAAGPPELACVQARLAVDNAADGWLSRHFAVEYAGQFDVFLPALARFRLPLPLGGTSNHFRAEVLRRVGGWDPFNVTEDADLGMRLARFGYRTGVISSSTWEEAPVSLEQWLRQRTRWFKGWMQTWIVHMRHPVRLLRELGFSGFLAFQLLVGGTVLSALVHPLFLALVITDGWSGAALAPGVTFEETVRKSLALIALTTGYLGSALFGFVGLVRRRAIAHAWVLATIPLYWLLLSAAAWRALLHLVIAPYLWEKTEHGRARTSRRESRRATTGTPPVRNFATRRPR